MMQIYQGVDIVDVAKFNRVFSTNPGFVYDIFTAQEREYCLSHKNSHIHFAGRFAAKEACLKALGIGMLQPGIPYTFQDIEVLRHHGGKPLLSLSGWAAKISAKRRIRQFTVSISHTSGSCLAMVILVGLR